MRSREQARRLDEELIPDSEGIKLCGIRLEKDKLPRFEKL
jgi:hypothetical protein